MMEHSIPEILAPARDRECLLTALRYGADAVYVGGKQFGMRASAANFDEAGLREAVALSHKAGAKVYVACNILPHEEEMEQLPEFLQMVQGNRGRRPYYSRFGGHGAGAAIRARCALHISVQFGAVNSAAVRRLKEMGASRVVLSRELSLDRDRPYSEKNRWSGIGMLFHGSQCMSVSGVACSHVLTGRDANRGDCAQPCRWRYHLLEEKRPGRFYPIEETEEGSFLLDAYDLCMLDYVAPLAAAGVSSFKIEGRGKAAYYVAGTVNAYRLAVDGYAASGCSSDTALRVGERGSGKGKPSSLWHRFLFWYAGTKHTGRRLYTFL